MIKEISVRGLAYIVDISYSLSITSVEKCRPRHVVHTLKIMQIAAIIELTIADMKKN